MKVYSSLKELFDAGIFRQSEIVVFWGGKGSGKSSLKAALECWFMQPKNAKFDLKCSNAFCDRLNNAGIMVRPPDDHLVFVNTYASTFGIARGDRNRLAYMFKATNFGLPSDKYKTELLIPYGKYSFDECQDIYDSHDGNLATFISKAFELSRQLELFIMMAVQRPMRLPKDVRDIATFVECCGKEHYYDDLGRLCKTVWTVKIIYQGENITSYSESRKRNEDLVDKTIKIAFEGNIYKCYDDHFYAPEFYRGRENEKPVFEKCQPVDYSEEGFKQYYKNTDSIDVPENYRGKAQKKGVKDAKD